MNRQMRGLLLVGACLFVGAPPAAAQESAAEEEARPTDAAIMRFENVYDGDPMTGWGGGPVGTIHFDSIVVHGGSGAARLARDSASPGEFTALTRAIPADLSGSVLELRGFLRTENVTGGAGLWLREDGSPGVVLQFDNMRNGSISGTTPWTEYRIRLPLDPDSRRLVFGVLLRGEGTVWADDLELRVDGEPAADAPAREVEVTILDTDREFAEGSGIELTALTPTQVENLAVLGRVWGFLKYHHPRIAAGELHWDYELFRVLPDVLGARGAEARNKVLAEWVDSLGVPDDCDPCARMPMGADVHLMPDLAWLDETGTLGVVLSRKLRAIHANRYAGGAQFFVSRVPNVGNPKFDHELPYADQPYPDAGYRILSLFRLWNIIEYWFPYRDQLEDDWSSVLREFLPRLVAAVDGDAYRLELLGFITRIHDTHANLWAALDVRPPRGACFLPVHFRFVEGKPTVTALAPTADRAGADDVAPPRDLRIGDVVTRLDGASVDSLVAAWIPYYSASNEAARLRDLARFLHRGPCGESSMSIERDGRALDLVVRRERMEQRPWPLHDRPGATFQLLSPDVAYLTLSSVRQADVPGYLEQARGTRGLVVDIRNYPSEFVVFALGGRLVEAPTEFARFTIGDPANPGAFAFTPPITLDPLEPRYEGEVAILVDESSISQSEYTAMALRAGPRAVVVGSTTAGADGNVSQVPLPGGLSTLISGIGVFYPDGTPTQRIGIVPDVEARPTVAGIRAGRDEVLEAALRHILGPDVEEADIRRMAAREER